MTHIAEQTAEYAALEWFEGLGYSTAHGPEIGPDAAGLERASYADILLIDRLRSALLTLIRSNMDETGALAETRDALLPKLLSGEVRVGERDTAEAVA